VGKILRPIITIPGRSVGHAHFTGARAIFYVFNSSLNKIFFALIASHSDNDSVYNPATAKQWLRYLEQFQDYEVNPDLVNTQAEEIFTQKLDITSLIQQVNFPSNEPVIALDSEDTVAGDELDINRVWHDTMLKEIRESTVTECKQFLEVFGREDRQNLFKQMNQWINETILEKMEHRWFSWAGDDFRKKAQLEIERIT
jgi:hypothetical protein